MVQVEFASQGLYSKVIFVCSNRSTLLYIITLSSRVFLQITIGDGTDDATVICSTRVAEEILGKFHVNECVHFRYLFRY